MTPLNRPRWTVTAAAAVAVVVGGTGYALASGGSDSGLPDAISLQDRVTATATVAAPPTGTPSLVDTIPAPVWRADASGSLSNTMSASWSNDTLTADSFSPDSVSADSVSLDSFSPDTVSVESFSVDTVSISSASIDSMSSSS